MSDGFTRATFCANSDWMSSAGWHQLLVRVQFSAESAILLGCQSYKIAHRLIVIWMHILAALPRPSQVIFWFMPISPTLHSKDTGITQMISVLSLLDLLVDKMIRITRQFSDHCRLVACMEVWVGVCTLPLHFSMAFNPQLSCHVWVSV